MLSTYLSAIQKFEGFTSVAKWDYAQHSNGYGTRARYPGEQIDAAEAERRFREEISAAREIVERHAAHMDEGTKAALTSLTFNAGDRWTRSGLGDAVRRNDLAAARDLFLQYNKAGGEVLPGLVARRHAEAAWMGMQPSDGEVSSKMVGLLQRTSLASSSGTVEGVLPTAPTADERSGSDAQEIITLAALNAMAMLVTPEGNVAGDIVAEQPFDATADANRRSSMASVPQQISQNAMQPSTLSKNSDPLNKNADFWVQLSIQAISEFLKIQRKNGGADQA